jgi:hypothetical protein
VTFESDLCLHCHTRLVYDPDTRRLAALEQDMAVCANAGLAGCNWLAEERGGLCASCALTRTRPADEDPEGLAGFLAAEAAKRRLLFGLADLGLPIVSWRERTGGLAFELLSSTQQPVTTGHADGVITLNLEETDPAHRERMRMRLHEPYRTVLGHFRHEIGHYYQPILLAPDPALEQRSRELFGDEREHYQQALDRHYRQGPPADWQQRHVSAYATMHPREDWAETFAHYLHLVDTMQTAAAYGIHVDGPELHTTDPAPLDSTPEHAHDDFEGLLEAWIPLTYALNAINRSMGESDLYPFVLSAAVADKLAFVDQLVRRTGCAASPTGRSNYEQTTREAHDG